MRLFAAAILAASPLTAFAWVGESQGLDVGGRAQRMLRIPDARMARLYRLFNEGVRYRSLKVVDPKRGRSRMIVGEDDVMEAVARLMDPLWLQRSLPTAGKNASTFVFRFKDKTGHEATETFVFDAVGPNGHSKIVRSVLKDVLGAAPGKPVLWTPAWEIGR